VLVAGAAGGIGGAFCDLVAARFSTATIVRLARDPSKLAPLPARCVDIGFDIGDEASIRDAVEQIPGSSVVDWVLVATGWLHDRVRRPEKTYKSLDAIHLLHAYRINAIGPALLVKHLIPRLNPSRPCKLGVLSARVGSISDNRLGGWHAYRASKAALNMLIKNIAIELARNNGRHVIVGLQPGTTDTALSAPFQRHVPVAQLQSPDYTARQLAEVMLRLRTEDSGGLFDFLGESFAP
jgi:NAD(P)-dependent dehydrogenase (short-subunit alcohol dehydrogenase family)